MFLAYVSTTFGVPNKSMGTMFSPIKNVSITSGYDAEMIGVKACMSASGISEGKPVTYDSEIEMILSAAQKCVDIIGVIIKYIDENILSGFGKAIPPNSNDIGRQLMAMVESIQPFSKNEQTINKNLNDLLMVIYLSNACKTQLMLNEKLTLL